MQPTKFELVINLQTADEVIECDAICCTCSGRLLALTGGSFASTFMTGVGDTADQLI